MVKRTKIVCTIGPASSTPAIIKQMIASGMNVARLNMSHGTYPAHRALIKAILSASKALGEPVTLLADLQGPKIRLGVLPEAGVVLKTGGMVEFTTATDAYRHGLIPVTHKAMHKDVKVGHRIFIDDGLLEVKVTKVHGQTVMAKVVNGGTVTSHKGMNFPDTTLSVDPITDKDKADLAFALKAGAQWIAMSFVTRAEDMKRLRGMMSRPAKIIVKIEKHEALKNFNAILKEADGIMVARGDLGVETPAEDVPLRQKEIIAKCRAAGKPVVVATQMLDSMMRNPRPTRAEVSDVANAVIDHAEGVMLSGETASGKYPVAAVAMMNKICLDTEKSVYDNLQINSIEHKKSSNELISVSIATLSRLHNIQAVV
ncbi:MAG: pyruvate kinase, partial [Patescibacteria group bacterium]